MAADPRAKDGDKGYEVKDKRAFNPDGELKESATAAEPSAPADNAEAHPAGADLPPREAPPMEFGTFILSLATAALFHLGDVHEKGKEPPTANLPLAKETIDIIEMLRDKTKGNLSKEETTFLDQILFDLRMRYVAKVKAPLVTN